MARPPCPSLRRGVEGGRRALASHRDGRVARSERTMTLAIHTRLGPYDILASLGAGGMGEVYRARDTRLDRDVAIKVLPEPMAHDPHALARFHREVKVIAGLSHPHLLAIYD